MCAHKTRRSSSASSDGHGTRFRRRAPALHVHELTPDRHRDETELHLITEAIVIVGGEESVLALPQVLQQARFEAACLLGFEAGIRDDEWPAGKRFRHGRRLDSIAVA